MGKQRQKRKCTICNESGHNKSTCTYLLDKQIRNPEFGGLHEDVTQVSHRLVHLNFKVGSRVVLMFESLKSPLPIL